MSKFVNSALRAIVTIDGKLSLPSNNFPKLPKMQEPKLTSKQEVYWLWPAPLWIEQSARGLKPVTEKTNPLTKPEFVRKDIFD